MPESNYVPYKRDSYPFIWYEQAKSSPPDVRLTVIDPKKPIGFSPWPDDPKLEWKKA